jgi:hypothetical protein
MVLTLPRRPTLVCAFREQPELLYLYYVRLNRHAASLDLCRGPNMGQYQICFLYAKLCTLRPICTPWPPKIIGKSKIWN